MKKVSDYSDSISVFLVTMEDKELFNRLQEKLSEAFKVSSVRDRYDKDYQYLVSLIDGEIIAAYRFRICKDAVVNGEYDLYTSQYFNYSDELKDILPYTIELGRAFCLTGNGLMSVLTCGVGPLVQYCWTLGIHYLIGQVSLSNEIYNLETIHKITTMFEKDFGKALLFEPRCSPDFGQNPEKYGFTGRYRDDLRIIKGMGIKLPTLFRAYAEMVEDGGIICNKPSCSGAINTTEQPFCVDTKLFTQKARDTYLSHEYNRDAFAFIKWMCSITVHTDTETVSVFFFIKKY